MNVVLITCIRNKIWCCLVVRLIFWSKLLSVINFTNIKIILRLELILRLKSGHSLLRCTVKSRLSAKSSDFLGKSEIIQNLTQHLFWKCFIDIELLFDYCFIDIIYNFIFIFLLYFVLFSYNTRSIVIVIVHDWYFLKQYGHAENCG